MRYSLLSRFEGGFLGCAIGQLGGIARRPHSQRLILAEEAFCPGFQLALAATESLVGSGRWQPQAWLQHLRTQKSSTLPLSVWRNSSAMALAVLPIIFYNCEDRQQLQSQLRETAAAWHLAPETLGDLLIWGDGIALVLNEKTSSPQWLHALLQRHSQTSPLGEAIALIPSLLEEEGGLTQALGRFSHADNAAVLPLATAFYCLAGTPSDFRLCLSRAQHSDRSSRLASALTGAIAGARNSLNGIPTEWRLAANSCQQARQATQASRQLFALWSGVYPRCGSLVPPPAIAMAGTLQPRRSRPMISQNLLS